MSYFTIIDLPTFLDARGGLTVLDEVLPFQIKRAYWIYGADGQTRGGHRHKLTYQALVSVHGKVTVYMDDGKISQTVVLDNPKQCLLVEPKDWHTMSFGVDSVLLVFASHLYDPNDYIDEPYGVHA